MAHIGAVLSSGGGRGVYAHTGFLLALSELGIDLDVIAGCSAGALVGGIAASGTDLHHWSDAISKLATREYWSPDPWYRMAWQMTVRKGRGYTGLSDTAAAIDFVRRNLAVQTFAECPIPLYVLATNLTRGTKTLFSSGELAPRIMASAAMPVLYRPVEIDGELYCDGAVIEFAPTEAICCRHQLDVLLIHHTAAQRDGAAGLARALSHPWSLIEVLYLLLYRQRPWYLAGETPAVRVCPYGCGAAIVVLEPPLPELNWPLSRGGPRVQQAAHAHALQQLAPHIEVIRADPRQLAERLALVSAS